MVSPRKRRWPVALFILGALIGGAALVSYAF
jgi:hypothetical protein